MASVLALCLGPDAGRTLELLGAGHEVTHREKLDDQWLAGPLAGERAPDLVLIGTAAEDPMPVLQRINGWSPAPLVAVVAPPGRHAEIADAVRFGPRVPAPTRTLASDDEDELRSALRELLDQAERRRFHQQVMHRVNRSAQIQERVMPRSARYLGVLMRQAPIGVVLTNEDSSVLAMNRLAEVMLETQEARTLGRRIDAVFAAASMPIGEDALPARHDGAPMLLERRTDAGGEQFLELTASSVSTEEGNAHLILLNDVTAQVVAERARRQVEEELRFGKSLLEAQTEAAVEGILVVDPQGKIVAYNRRFQEMWQIPDEVVVSRSDEAAIRAVLDQLVDPDAFVERIRYLYKHPDQTSRDELPLRDSRVFSRYSAPVRASDGAYYGRVWFFHDVTEQRRNEESLRFVAEATEVLAETLDATQILQRLTRLAVPRLADWCLIYGFDASGELRRLAIAYADPTNAEAARALDEFPLDPDATGGVARVIRTGAPAFYPDVNPAWMVTDVVGGEEMLPLVERLRPRSWMCLPLAARGRVLGAMSFVTAESGRRYDQDDLRLAGDVAYRAALALDNAIVYQQKAHIARTLQDSLLPPAMPVIPGIAIEARYHAAGEGHDVGGDFYDLFPTGPDGWGVIMGDVVGKGPEAAALTALTRYTVRAAALQVADPRRILGVLNEAIYRQHAGARFCTAVYVELEHSDEHVRCRLARGGHPPPLLVRASGTIETLDPPGMLLGSFPDLHLEQIEVLLGPGDTLVLYTDGVIEARDDEHTFGYRRLRELLADAAGEHASVIATRIEQAVLAFQGHRPRDDVAIVVLQHHPAPVGLPGAEQSKTFPPSPEVLTEVRGFVQHALEAAGAQDEADMAVLLANELAANAIIHAATPFMVGVQVQDERVHVDVSDSGGGEAAPVATSREATSGRGLMIVAAASDDWGVEQLHAGKRVWFELVRQRMPQQHA